MTSHDALPIVPAARGAAPRLALDIHTHSTFSDGVKTPEELLAMAGEARLAVHAITDHDSLLSFLHLVDEAPGALDEIPFVFLPGAELTTNGRFGKFDLLYFFPRCAVGDFAALEARGVALPERLRGRRVRVADIPPDALEEVRAMEGRLRAVRDERLDRMKTMFSNFKGKYPEMACFDWDEFCRDNGIDMVARTSPGTVGRPHLADYMVKKGVISSRNEAFQAYLADGLPCVESHKGFDLEEVVAEAAGRHAFPVVAHSLMKQDSKILQAAEALAAAGLRGLEVYHRKHDKAKRGALARRCAELGLVQTIGSDFHSRESGHDFGVPEFNAMMPEDAKRAALAALFAL